LGTVRRVTADPLALMAEVDRATARLLATADALTDAQVAEPSLLPGWTRGHVLTHLARNADGLTNLLTWARTGVVTPQYESWARRESDIEDGSSRGATEQVADLRKACERFAEAGTLMPAEAWTVVLDTENPQPAARVAWRRLREVEVHHVDLSLGYGVADWPDAFSHRVLHEVVAGLHDRGDAFPVVLRSTELGHTLTVGDASGAPTISGRAHALGGWLTGRTRGEGLTIDPDGPLPEPPEWI